MLLATFLLTIFVDLITGIAVGVVLGALLFLHRMAESVEIAGGQSSLEDVADDRDSRPHYDAQQATDRDVMVYHISGAFFFGAAARVLGVLERVGTPPRLLVLDFKDVPLIDTTAARSLVTFVNKVGRSGTSVVFAAARPTVRRTFDQSRVEATARAILRDRARGGNDGASVKTLGIDVDLQSHITARLGRHGKPLAQISRQVEAAR